VESGYDGRLARVSTGHETVRGDEEGPNARVGRAPQDPFTDHLSLMGLCRPKDTVSLGAIRLHGGQGDADRDLRDQFDGPAAWAEEVLLEVQATDPFTVVLQIVVPHAQGRNLAPFETEVDLGPAGIGTHHGALTLHNQRAVELGMLPLTVVVCATGREGAKFEGHRLWPDPAVHHSRDVAVPGHGDAPFEGAALEPPEVAYDASARVDFLEELVTLRVDDIRVLVAAKLDTQHPIEDGLGELGNQKAAVGEGPRPRHK